MITTNVNGTYKEVDEIWARVGNDYKEIIKVWDSNDSKWVYEAVGSVEGTLPLTAHADGSDTVDYKIYGASGGVGIWDATAQSYKLPMVSSDGTTDITTPIYIGDEPLYEDEYVDYGEQKVYKYVDGVLTPTDPPVPLPALPTFDDADTVFDYDETPAPSSVEIKYKKG